MTNPTKPNPVETAQAVLRMLNNMNMAANNAIVTMTDELPKDSAAFHHVMLQMNVVLNGIVSLTTIYEQARQRAQAAEDQSLQNREDLAALPTARGADMRDLSTREVPAAQPVVQPTVDVARQATEIIGNGLQRLRSLTPAGKGPTPAAQEPVRSITEKELTALDLLVGDEGVLFKHLSPEVHPLGQGWLKPGENFQCFVENVQSVALDELQYYPAGFYDTKTDGPQELYFKHNELEFLWVFGGEPRQLYMRRDEGWKSVETFSRSMIAMMTQRIDDALRTLKIGTR